MIEGWPSGIPFCNLSDASSSLSDLEGLLRDWRSGKIYWKQITGRELRDLEKDRDVQIHNGELEVPSRRRRSDYGMKHKKHGKPQKEIPSGDEEAAGVQKKRRKSRKGIPSGDEQEDEATGVQKKRRKSRKEIPSGDEQEDEEAAGGVQKKRRKSRKEIPSDTEEDDSTPPASVVPTNLV
jgi:hypothetical protein